MENISNNNNIRLDIYLSDKIVVFFSLMKVSLHLNSIIIYNPYYSYLILFRSQFSFKFSKLKNKTKH